jgi:hypothetical protein
MENHDSSFRDIARAGDVLVWGFNFGCGSSREQAATAILAKKILLVLWQHLQPQQHQQRAHERRGAAPCAASARALQQGR